MRVSTKFALTLAPVLFGFLLVPRAALAQSISPDFSSAKPTSAWWCGESRSREG
jgi:hypothetical protein